MSHFEWCKKCLLVITHADESRGSKACVCLHDRTKMAETTITNHQTYHKDSSIRSKGQRSRSQAHKVQRHSEGNRVAGVSLHSVEWPAWVTVCGRLNFVLVLVHFERLYLHLKLIYGIYVIFRSLMQAIGSLGIVEKWSDTMWRHDNVLCSCCVGALVNICECWLQECQKRRQSTMLRSLCWA